MGAYRLFTMNSMKDNLETMNAHPSQPSTLASRTFLRKCPNLPKSLFALSHGQKNALLLTGGIFYCLVCTKIAIFTSKKNLYYPDKELLLIPATKHTAGPL